MTTRARRIALVCMTPETDTKEAHARLPSYGIRRILASVADDPALAGSDVTLIDYGRPDVAKYVAAIDASQPDLIGISIYVWSTPCMVEVARQIKRRRPGSTIVFGGPSARTAFFGLPPYAEPYTYLDALVPSDGEFAFREIAHLPTLSRTALQSVPGLDLPSPTGWIRTGPRRRSPSSTRSPRHSSSGSCPPTAWLTWRHSGAVPSRARSASGGPAKDRRPSSRRNTWSASSNRSPSKKCRPCSCSMPG